MDTTTSEMTAVRNHGPRDDRLETVPKPTAGPGEVVIRVDASGICGSDGKCFPGGGMFWEGRDPWVKTPVTPGHEFFGTVTELGDEAGEAGPLGWCSSGVPLYWCRLEPPPRLLR